MPDNAGFTWPSNTIGTGGNTLFPNFRQQAPTPTPSPISTPTDFGFSNYGTTPSNLTGQFGPVPIPGSGYDPNTVGQPAPTGYQNTISGINAATGLANAYLGFKNLKLGKKQFQFTKDTFNTNLANQAKLTNAEIVNREIARLSATGRYNDTPDLRAIAEANVNERGSLVSGAPV